MLAQAFIDSLARSCDPVARPEERPRRLVVGAGGLHVVGLEHLPDELVLGERLVLRVFAVDILVHSQLKEALLILKDQLEVSPALVEHEIFLVLALQLTRGEELVLDVLLLNLVLVTAHPVVAAEHLLVLPLAMRL